MASESNIELAQFQQFINLQLQSGRVLSPEEALELWRIEHPEPEALEAAVEALRQALADIKAGDEGVPFDDFVRECRQRHGLSTLVIEYKIHVLKRARSDIESILAWMFVMVVA